MKLIKQTHMEKQQGSTTKIYIVELFELGGSSPDRFVVNVRYGNKGRSLWEGTKTNTSVPLDEATEIFDSVVVNRKNRGFEMIGVAVENSPTPSGTTPLNTPGQESEPHLTRTPEELIVYYLHHPPAHWSLSRIIWRAGELELQDAVDPLINLVGKGNWMADYAIAWSLGRLKDPRGFETVNQLRSHRNDTVKRIAREAYCALATSEQRGQLLSTISGTLSNVVDQLIINNQPEALAKQLVQKAFTSGMNKESLLEKIYLLALDNSCCHRALQLAIPELKIKQNQFKPLRYLYKMAEFRLDGVILGQLIALFDQTAPRRWRPFSKWTSEYFTRRHWRTLRKLGDNGDHRYLDLALGVLTAITPEDGRPSRSGSRYIYDPRSRRYRRLTGSYGPFSHLKTAGHLLYQNSSAHIFNTTENRFFTLQGKEITRDAGAYYMLWREHPRYLLELLLKGSVEPVHQFAINNLRSCRSFVEGIPTETLLPLCKTEIKLTADYLAQLFRERYRLKTPETPLLKALLFALTRVLNKLGREWVEEHPELLKNNHSLLLELLISNQEKQINWLDFMLPKLHLTHFDQATIMGQLLRRVVTEELSELFAIKLANLLVNRFSSPFDSKPFQQIIPLMDHPDLPIQVIGAALLKHPAVSIDHLPPELIRSLINSPAPQLQQEGIALLIKLDDYTLRQQSEMVLQFALSDKPGIREAAIPVLQRLIENNPDLQGQFLPELITPLFRTEPQEGYHDELIELITESILSPDEQPDRDLVWRLLRAKAKGANNLGAMLLPQIPFGGYSIKQWARLGNTPVYTVRKQVQHIYNTHIDAIKADPDNSIIILHTKWRDTRSFAINYFKTHFTIEEWRPELLITICDHTNPELQQFGRELITRFFDEADGITYLTRLSQHPTQNMELFVTSFLDQYASGDLEQIKSLKSYFITILSGINRGRAARDRVIRFLVKESLNNRDVARFTLDIFNRQVITCVVKDRESYLTAMRDLFLKYPDLNTPITVKQAPIRGYQPEITDGGNR